MKKKKKQNSFDKIKFPKILIFLFQLGLDPAKPMFENMSDKDGTLDPTDADFVDVIHTCAGMLGYSKPLGHV